MSSERMTTMFGFFVSAATSDGTNRASSTTAERRMVNAPGRRRSLTAVIESELRFALPRRPLHCLSDHERHHTDQRERRKDLERDDVLRRLDAFKRGTRVGVDERSRQHRHEADSRENSGTN